MIHRNTIARLSRRKIHFSDDSNLDIQAVIYCTGWRWTPAIQFIGIAGLQAGIPTKIDTYHDIRSWESQRQRIDARILKLFPYLHSAPSSSQTTLAFGAEEDGKLYTAWCLHRAIAPRTQAYETATKNLAFLGNFSTIPTAALSEIQALWAIAFLHDSLTLPREIDSIENEALEWTRWSQLRYPFSHCSRYLDTTFDVIPYFDVLLSDMHLNTRRKSSWWKELTEPYSVADYRDVVLEFKKRHN